MLWFHGFDWKPTRDQLCNKAQCRELRRASLAVVLRGWVVQFTAS